MTILHASTGPNLLTHLRQTLSSTDRADVAVGYFTTNAADASVGTRMPKRK